MSQKSQENATIFNLQKMPCQEKALRPRGQRTLQTSQQAFSNLQDGSHCLSTLVGLCISDQACRGASQMCAAQKLTAAACQLFGTRCWQACTHTR